MRLPTIKLPHCLALLLAFSAICLAAMPDFAQADTFSVTSPTNCNAPGGYQWAIEQANATPGKDTISIDVSKVFLGPCVKQSNSNYTTPVTESVTIEGNGNLFEGPVTWVTSNGIINPYGQCLGSTAIIVEPGGSLLQVGATGGDALGVEVTLRNFKTSRLSQVAKIKQGGQLLIEDAEIVDTFSVMPSCGEPIIDADRADITLRRTTIRNSSAPSNSLFSSVYPIAGGHIFGSGGELVLDDVTIVDSFGPFSPAIQWAGGTVKIVDSKLLNSSGMWLTNVQTDFVNSIFKTAFVDQKFSDNILLQGISTFRSQGSTFYWGGLNCSECLVTGGSGSNTVKGFGIGNLGTLSSSIRFESTALGSVTGGGELIQKLWGDPRVFSSDNYTWVQPTAGQDATELAAILPNALTTEPGLPTRFGELLAAQTVVPLATGVLVEAVPNAGAGGVNELRSPINGLPIAFDVDGAPRVYANGTRNIGAVQNPEAPSLTVQPGDSEVTLGWSPTPSGFAGGYEICSSTATLPDPLTGNCPATSTTVGQLVTTQTLTGLTNGSPYWFSVRDSGSIWSKVITATPMGPIGVAQPTAVNVGDGSLQVFWAEPSTLGGYTGLLSYGVLYRPLGTQGWLRGSQELTARTTLIPELVNGITYEIGVFAQSDDGGLTAVLGTITGTPQAAPGLSFAAPPTWPQNSPLVLTPSVTLLQGSGTYGLQSGSLPVGMTLNAATGVISGTPTTVESTSATIRLTDGGTGLFVDAVVALNIVAPPPAPVPELHYPTIQATVGNGPLSATPTTANIPAGATYSLRSGQSLPDGFTLDASTGVISGTPTRAPGQILNVDIQACWGGCAPPNEVRITTMSFYILPSLQYPITTTASAGVSASISPTVDLWSGGVFSIGAGTLPDGMSLDATTGVISGAPQTATDTQVTVRYSTGIGVSGLDFVASSPHIKVVPQTIALSYPAIKAAAGQHLSVLPTVSGLTGTPAYRLLSGSLPPGLQLNPATGAITGTPTGPAGLFLMNIEVSGPYGSQSTTATIEIFDSVTVPVMSGYGLLALVLLTLGIGLVVFRRMV